MTSRPGRRIRGPRQGFAVLAPHRHLALAGEQGLMLQHQHRIVVADRRFQHAIGLGRARRADDLQARHRHEPGFRRGRMLRPEAQARAADGADRHRHGELPARHEAMLGDAVDDLVEADAEEIGEHDLDDGPIAGDGEAQRRAHEAGLGDGRVAHPGMAEFLDQPLAGLEGSAGGADVLAHDEGLGIAAHLLLQGGDDGFAIGDLLCGHGRVQSLSLRRTSWRRSSGSHPARAPSRRDRPRPSPRAGRLR